jgi:hypothetical protein
MSAMPIRSLRSNPMRDGQRQERAMGAETNLSDKGA